MGTLGSMDMVAGRTAGCNTEVHSTVADSTPQQSPDNMVANRNNPTESAPAAKSARAGTEVNRPSRISYDHPSGGFCQTSLLKSYQASLRMGCSRISSIRP